MECYANIAIRLLGAQLTELERLEAVAEAAVAHIKDSARKIEQRTADILDHKQRTAIAAQKLQNAVDEHKATLLLSTELDGSDAGYMHDGNMGLRG